jgi:hypothetical protein
MPAEVLTMCFHSRDAVERYDSKLTFEMPKDRMKNGTFKVALASCEFPMVQWTVEEDWNRLYLNEGIRIQDGANTLALSFQEQDETVVLTLPPRLNKIVKAAWRSDKLVVECTHPHGLWCEDGTPLLPAFQRGVWIVSGSSGDRSLSVALEDGCLEYVSPTEFSCKKPFPASDVVNATHVYVPTVASPHELCRWLTHAARRRKVTFKYDAESDKVHVTFPQNITGFVRAGGPLATMCGVSPLSVRVDDDKILPSEATRLWDYIEMPTGFYAPCHRPMCTGQPMKFGTEMEAAINRLYFPILSEGATHNFIFTDPDARVHNCTIPWGRYNPRQLCLHLERKMTSIANAIVPGTVFTVVHEQDRFTFSCERNVAGRIVPATFSILFHHPMSVDAARFGFSAQPISGSASYTAPRPTRAAVACGSVSDRYFGNVVRVSEIASEKRFRMHGVTPPGMTAFVIGGSLDTQTLIVRTFINGKPFAHGYQLQDAVKISRCGKQTLTVDGKETTAGESSASVPSSCTCIVTQLFEECDVLAMTIPKLGGLTEAGTCLQLSSDAEPWNMCFCLPKTLPPHLMGFDQKAVQFGIDGSVPDARNWMMTPFEAPNVHCLDHPDYVLITMSETSGALLEHRTGGHAKQVFCKLSLYPLFREERMLPRDSSLLRDRVGRFTIEFWNPDMKTPYHFHGAHFSFSLSFICAVPE